MEHFSHLTFSPNLLKDRHLFSGSNQLFENVLSPTVNCQGAKVIRACYDIVLAAARGSLQNLKPGSFEMKPERQKLAISFETKDVFDQAVNDRRGFYVYAIDTYSKHFEKRSRHEYHGYDDVVPRWSLWLTLDQLSCASDRKEKTVWIDTKSFLSATF